MPTPAGSSRALVLALAIGIAAIPSAARAREQAQGLPPGVELNAEHISQPTKNGDVTAEGAVSIKTSEGRIQADKILFRDGHIVEAQGNVLIVWGNNRISGTSMIYDMGIKDDPDPEKRIARGVIQQAIGQVDQEQNNFFFTADTVDTIGPDRVVLHSAVVTACTQPVPYWSFAVSTARIHIDGYAHMFNVRPRIGKVPVFYLPYLAWPVKRGRTVGLLFPEFGTTRTRGRIFSIPLFIPLGDSADLTLFGEHYSLAGWGGGGRLRIMPNRDGYVEFAAHYIQDQVAQAGRYQVLMTQHQSFLNGFTMVSDVNIVSDFDYFTDFVRNLTYASSPTILGRLTFTRNGDWTSLMVQEQYREQLFEDGSTLTQTSYPEIQWRGRSHKLGKSPLYFSYQSSFNWLGQQGPSIDASYYRADVFPQLSLPVSPFPWLDITPTISARSTYWSEQQEPVVDFTAPVTIVDKPLTRNLLGAAVEFSGPRLYRIFEKTSKDGETKTKVKNTIEPKLTYTYQQAFDQNNNIILYDEVDRFGVDANAATYGVASRVIAQRPRAAPVSGGGEGEKILVPDSASGELREVSGANPPGSTPGDTADSHPDTAALTPGTAAPQDTSAALEPVEIASIEVDQTYSFNSFPSQADLNGDGIVETLSHFSAVTMTGRYNPSRVLSFNLSSRYDVLFKSVAEVAFSGNYHEPMATGLFSFVYRPGLGYQQTSGASGIVFEPKKDSTQVRFQGTFGPFASRLRLGLDTTLNINPLPGSERIPYQRWRIEYYTQCCGFLAEYLKNDYTAFARKEFRFAIDLRGIGKLLDFNQGIP